MEVIRTLLQNKLYHTFQLYWLSFAIDSVLVWIFGYTPQILFTLNLLLHVINAWLFYLLLVRLNVSRRLAYMAGALFVLIPTAHGPLFWFLGTSFYVRPPMVLFLYLLSLAGTLEKGRLTAPAACWQALLSVLILFLGGAPSFFLLLLAGPLLVVCFFPLDRWKVAAMAAAINWAAVAVSLGISVPFINSVPPDHAQLVARYDFSQDFLVRNWRKFYHFHLEGMSGFGPHAYYRVQASGAQILAAAFAVGILAAGWILLPEDGRKRLHRVALFAAGMAVLSYIPLIYLIGGTLRHYYTFSPYVSLLLVALGGIFPGRLGSLPYWALCGYFAACTVAEIEQCWTPMSRNLEAVKARLRHLQKLEAGDLVVIPGTPMVVGTAPNFALLSGPWDQTFAEQATREKDLEFWREIVIERGRPRLFHRHSMRDVSVADLARAHVLIGNSGGPYTARRYWAEPVGPDRYRLHCLKEPGCEAGESVFSGGQLVSRRDEVYFAKPFEHGNLEHLHR